MNDLEVVPGDPAPSATVEFQPDPGWTVLSVAGPAGMTCDTTPSTDVHCTITGNPAVPAGAKDFTVKLQATTKPASTTSMLSWTYADENATVSQQTPIPAN